MIAQVSWEDFDILDIYKNREDAIKRLEKEEENDKTETFCMQEYELK